MITNTEFPTKNKNQTTHTATGYNFMKSANKIICERYLGNRGIYEPVKRCSQYEDLWFIVFEECPEDVEISFVCGIYECYDFVPSKGFKWNKANFKAIKESLSKN
jgi:hypothetical protein